MRTSSGAREHAGRYRTILWGEAGEWYGRGVELPNTLEDGATPNECVETLRKAFVAVLATMIELGQPIPSPED
jgi:predicted RNase H-like HicB family nuclease